MYLLALSFCKIEKKNKNAQGQSRVTMCYYFHLPIGLFHGAKFQKDSYSESRVMAMHHFWTENGSFAPKKSFFWKKLLI